MQFPDPSRLAVKICGLISAEQARAVAEAGADALGLNFWSKSKRYIAPATAAEWHLKKTLTIPLVAVLVNADDALLQEIISLDVVHVLQLHGDESPAECARIMALGLPVIKALQVRDRESLSVIGDYPCETILLDAYCPDTYGGEGKTFPWELAIEAMAQFPEKRFILAGGLNAANVAEAVARVQPAGVDVASGVELAPGIKDLDAVQDFITNARAAASRVDHLTVAP